MSHVALLYNPIAGKKPSDGFVRTVTEFYNSYGMEVNAFCSDTNWDEYFSSPHEYKTVLVAGGDGTLNRAVNLMIEHDVDVPIGVVPVGTVNDYAHQLGIPSNLEDCLKTMIANVTCRSDVGVANGRCFINVCGVGLFTNGYAEYDQEMKYRLGKLAYYLQGIGQLTNLKSCKLRLTTEEAIIEDDFYILLALNGRSCGGFRNLAQEACIDDGLLEFIGIRKMPIAHIPRIITKLAGGNIVDDKYTLYLKTDKMRIERLDVDNDMFIYSDLDGDKAIKLPLEISTMPKALTFLTCDDCSLRNFPQ